MNQLNVKAELNRRKSTTARMLEAFKLKRQLTTTDLNRFGTGCSSRLYELRKEGHKILALYERPGFYRYIYQGHADDPSPETTPLPMYRRMLRRKTLEAQD